MSFEVPCACGRHLAVTAGDAGTTVRCDCGRTHEVPDLRTLREMPRRTKHGPPARKESPPAPTPRFAWVFVVACGLIPVLTIGGLIPAFLGATGAASCIGVARKEAWSVGLRVALCAAITVACWALFLAVYGDILVLLLQQRPKPGPNRAT
jgi:hypothetical protein